MKIAVAQFQPKDRDKKHNLSTIDKLTERAKKGGADLITFHEMSITAYTHTKNLELNQIAEIAEQIPVGESSKQLIEISGKYNIPVLAGLIEKDNRKLYNTYICAYKGNVVARYRKLHPFINKHMSAGNEYVVFDLLGWKCGILTCYDNNIIENVRATVLLGAELIFAPHVTCCTPSNYPGSGYVDNKYWMNRDKDPESLRSEFDGPKGREWLMRWLPARAYDNGVYYAFTNPIGYDGDQLKNGNSMILDPYGEVLAEIRSFEDDIAIANVTKDKLTLSGGYRYRNARRPDLYRSITGKDHNSHTKPIWLNQDE